MRAQAERYGAQFAAGSVEAIEPLAEGYAARWTDGSATARKVVLATGVTDVAPTMPHLADALQQGALRYCPVCDGYEVRGQAVGLVADEGSDAFEALYLRHFTDRHCETSVPGLYAIGDVAKGLNQITVAVGDAAIAAAAIHRALLDTSA